MSTSTGNWNRSTSLGPPTAKKSALFSCVSVNFFGKTGRILFFRTNLCITEIPVASWVFWHTYRPCPMIPSRRNVDACILHACDVSFTIANYNVMGTSSATDKCTKNSQLAMGVSAIYGFVEKYETLPILPFIYWRLKCCLFRGGGS